MTAATTTERRPSPLAQWWVLTKRFIAPTLRNGELALTIASSVVFTAGLYIPLSHVMGTATKGVSSSYAQYIMPLIALQAVTFAAMSTAFRAATDSLQGLNRRFRSMPMAPLTPVAARISAAVYRCSVALAVALICGHVIGFRFYRGAEYRIDSLPKAKIELAVDDSIAEQVMEAVCNVARTGQAGDGKVWIFELEQALRVRTGETGPDAI